MDDGAFDGRHQRSGSTGHIIPETNVFLIPLNCEDFPHVAVEPIQGGRERDRALSSTGLAKHPNETTKRLKLAPKAKLRYRQKAG